MAQVRAGRSQPTGGPRSRTRTSSLADSWCAAPVPQPPARASLWVRAAGTAAASPARKEASACVMTCTVADHDSHEAANDGCRRGLRSTTSACCRLSHTLLLAPAGFVHTRRQMQHQLAALQFVFELVLWGPTSMSTRAWAASTACCTGSSASSARQMAVSMLQPCCMSTPASLLYSSAAC
jgi:hypothetical protein